MLCFYLLFFFFFFKQKTAYEIRLSLVGSEMCIRDRPPDAVMAHRAAVRNPAHTLVIASTIAGRETPGLSSHHRTSDAIPMLISSASGASSRRGIRTSLSGRDTSPSSADPRAWTSSRTACTSAPPPVPPESIVQALEWASTHANHT